MVSYLKPADRPVVDRLEHREVVYAKDQPEYVPLRVLESNTNECRVMSRWTLTDEQRALVAAGNDIFLELLTFNRPLQPILLSIRDDAPAMAEWVAAQYQLELKVEDAKHGE